MKAIDEPIAFISSTHSLKKFDSFFLMRKNLELLLLMQLQQKDLSLVNFDAEQLIFSANILLVH